MKDSRDEKRKVLNHDDIDLSDAVSGDTENTFVFEYFANLRLHLRSEKRAVKERDEERINLIKFSEEVQVKIYDDNNYHNEYNNGTHSERVVIFDDKDTSYATIKGKINLENHTKINTDFIENKLDIGGQLYYKFKNTTAFWYLLFGCESLKNPAAIIHNCMMLEIKDWQENFDKKLPMCSGRVLSKALPVNHYIKDYMPYGYHYQEEFVPRGDTNLFESNAKSFMDTEGDFVQYWLSEKWSKKTLKRINEIKDAKKYMQEVVKLICECLDNWGIGFIKVQIEDMFKDTESTDDNFDPVEDLVEGLEKEKFFDTSNTSTKSLSGDDSKGFFDDYADDDDLEVFFGDL